MVKQVFHVHDMHCSTCVMHVESIEDELPGIRRVKASYQKSRMEVEYDESTVNETEIIAAVKRKGYEAVAVRS